VQLLYNIYGYSYVHLNRYIVVKVCFSHLVKRWGYYSSQATRDKRCNEARNGISEQARDMKKIHTLMMAVSLRVALPDFAHD